MNASVVFLVNLVVTVAFAALMLAEYLRGDASFTPGFRGRACQKSLWRSVLNPATVLVVVGLSLVVAVLSVI
jgi:hypothetical protein